MCVCMSVCRGVCVCVCVCMYLCVSVCVSKHMSIHGCRSKADRSSEKLAGVHKEKLGKGLEKNLWGGEEGRIRVQT